MKNRALLLIDFQKGIESPSQQLYRLPAVLEKVNQRIAVYRQHHAPIILFNMKKPNYLLTQTLGNF